jgi:hypothetical protein
MIFRICGSTHISTHNGFPKIMSESHHDTVPVQAEKPADRPGKARLKSLRDLDQRTASAKRAKELIAAIAADLGGADSLTAAQQELVQRACLLGAFLADCEARWLAGEAVDVPAWLSATDRQRRLLESLGIHRKPRDVTDLASYIAKKERDS